MLPRRASTARTEVGEILSQSVANAQHDLVVARAREPERSCYGAVPSAPGTGLRQAPGELPCRLRATVGAVAERPAAPACASRGRAFSASCRFASAASTVNRVPLARP
jgi:hypothetical protein